MRRPLMRAGSLPLIAFLAGACSDAGPSTQNQLSFNLATQTATSPAAARGSFAVVGTPETFSDGTNTLVISKVELVMREIELHRAGAAADCADGVSDDCEELELGPVLVDLPLGTPGAARSFSVQIAPGTYDKVEFKIHRASSDDAGFIQANPDLAGVSVRVSGTYNDADFTYKGSFESEMEFELNPALVANETGATDLTVLVDLDRWFRDQTGALLDPGTANSGQPNMGLVEQNIRSSLDAFEDEDRDGHEDGPNHQ
jgi:hypothetical protein